MQKPDIFHLALMILHDQCPPDNKMYYCNMGEDPECDCTMCWSNYLFWAQNGFKKEQDPYKFDRKRDDL
jgi:hypothetical protein